MQNHSSIEEENELVLLDIRKVGFSLLKDTAIIICTICAEHRNKTNSISSPRFTTSGFCFCITFPFNGNVFESVVDG